jgi:hypothetical protein
MKFSRMQKNSCQGSEVLKKRLKCVRFELMMTMVDEQWDAALLV